MRVAHLMASPFFGGPERQVLGLAQSLPAAVQSIFVSFPESGLCQPFLQELHRHGMIAEALEQNSPRLWRSIQELRRTLHKYRVDLLCCHGYKADLLGLPVARQLGLPIVSVSRGWTAATWKVRLYEIVDRFSLWMMDRVVCVSEGQARKVRRVGIPAQQVRVIRNAICTDRFAEPDEPGRAFLQSFFPRPRKYLIGSAGRFSPEKGFCHLVTAAAEVIRHEPEAGFLLFGTGPLVHSLVEQIAQTGLREHFVLADFRADLDRWLSNFDVFALPSHTEGLPNVVLEAFAARVPVVATAVGGTPEVIEEGQNGFLVPAGQPGLLAERLRHLLQDDRLRQTMGMSGYYRVRDHFTFETQAQQYVQLFHELLGTNQSQPGRQREGRCLESCAPEAEIVEGAQETL